MSEDRAIKAAFPRQLLDPRQTKIGSGLGFPLAVYEGFFREWKYGLATQTFGAWMVDHKGLGVGLVLGGIITVLLFWVVRKLPRTWWIWCAVVTLLSSSS